ncbi:MAG: GIY-YIG nuclease family protein [Lentimicrobiaceae bacterium]|nr:GIY-YIG nuclease family protein [Lentimicrobiaceae bacterium]MCB9014773.1 GIY-YIG nuclease family protein [Lentimicrobiaceae bacterium]MCB9014774.1 GIY-YIG nuclease family protein [Lentimicrobiaceae bacterium]MCO5266282.1 GIY-YIG nuclease family protein [Lentimicrobium sp.]
MGEFLVYILYSEKEDFYYIGQTENVNIRVQEHLHGKYDRAFTKRADDWTVIQTISCHSKQQAICIEQHIKRMKSRVYIENLQRYPEMVEKLIKRYS